MRQIYSLFLVGAVLAAASTSAHAVKTCGAGHLRDGSITVRASGVVGTLSWGGQLGAESSSFDNQATCIVSSGARARGCLLAAVGVPQRTTPPASCTIFLNDTGGQRCAAFVRGCLVQPLPISCAMFPANNVWNADITALPVHAMSDAYITSIGSSAVLHPDFGSGFYAKRPIGIPYTVVPSIQPPIPISFQYADESDPGPYPIPPFAPIEGGAHPGAGVGDRHVLIVDSSACRLYEIYDAHWHGRGASWTGGSGATWDLTSNALRTDTWTSADAAGLPILPGLTRYDEVALDSLKHALRFTAPTTQHAYVWPARHFASSSTDTNLPPMGIRLRLKASVDVSTFSAHNQVILNALKHYGMFLADNGSPMFLSGVPDAQWDNDDLHQLQQLHGSDFEVVDESSLMVAPDSGQVP